jgi:hypothetical protein
LTPELLARWADWQRQATVANPVGLMIAHLKEGKTAPPLTYRNGNGHVNGARAGPRLPPNPITTWAEAEALSKQFENEP